jgi:uncharacterized protein YhjY with autotransporter beta-barrel domain
MFITSISINSGRFLLATLFTGLSFAGLSAQVFAATAVNDVYEADQLTVFGTKECSGSPGEAYVLTPSPFSNDTFTGQDPLVIINVNATEISAPQGAFVSVNGQASPPEIIYDTSCSSIPFTAQVILEYSFEDSADPNAGLTTAQIFINPPTPPATTNDNYDADNPNDIQEIPSSVTGLFDYVLQRSPLDNDNVTAPADVQQTLSAQGNFTAAAGTVGTLQNTRGQTAVFTYSPGVPFTQIAVFNYFLVDGNGNRIQGTDATITITPPAPPLDAQDDAVIADQLQTVIDPVTNNIGYQFSALENDIFPNNDLSNLDLALTLADSNFVPAQGTSGIIQAVNNNGIIFTYYPQGPFNSTAVFTYTIYDLGGNSDSAQITITAPGNLPQPPVLTRESDIEDACDVELANQQVPAICNDEMITPTERMLQLSTITAQSDAFVGMQGDLIGNVRQRMSENRSVYNPASVAGLNSNLFGKQVPIGRIVQELLKPLTGGAAADDMTGSGRLGFFLNGTFSVGERDQSNFTTGYDQEGYNFTSGIDYRINTNFIAGAALSIANEETDFSANRGKQDADLTSLSFYANYFPSNALYLDFLVMLTQGDLDIDRNVNIGLISEVARADTEAELWSYAGTLGYHWNSGAWEMDGYGRVEFTNGEIDGYAESGSSFDLTVADQETESLEAALGFKVARVMNLKRGVIIPSLDLEWLSQIEDDVRFIGVNMEQLSSGFSVQDEGADSSYYNAAFSLSSVFANGFSAYMRVESQFGDDFLSRTRYSGGLRWEF